MNTSNDKRRQIIFALGASALANALPAIAQTQSKAPDKLWRIGFLAPRKQPALMEADFIGGFPQGMRERGYVEGKNLTIEWRFADGDLTRLPKLAEELVQLKVDVLIGAGPQAIGALKQATTTIPIVMGVPGDPVSQGFVASLARPGGNITGATINAGEINAKRLQMLREISPRVSRVAVLMNPDNRGHVAALAAIQAAGQQVKVKTFAAEANTSRDIEAAFTFMKREKAGAVIVQTDAIFNAHTRQIADLALNQRLPLITGIREYVDAGCLMSYGASFRDNFYRAAYYADRIFKGAKPADLPVEQPTRFELFINGKTAKALGLTIPQALLITAEKVIE